MDKKQSFTYTPSMYLNDNTLSELRVIDEKLENKNIVTNKHLICPYCKTSYRKPVFKRPKKERRLKSKMSDTDFYRHLKREQDSKTHDCPYCHKEIRAEIRDI